MKFWWMFDAFFIFYVYPMDLFGAFDGFSIDTRWMFGRYSMNAPFHTSYLPLPISHFLFPMSTSFFDRRLPISHCRWPGLAECAKRLNPPPLPYGKSWRVESKPQATSSDHILQISDPLISPPAAPRIPPGHCATIRLRSKTLFLDLLFAS